jgi:RNA polymerase sigma-70 factor (ECF subfamily)
MKAKIIHQKETHMDNGASSYLRFLNDDKEGFVELVKEYKDGLVLFLNCYTNDIHIAEEAADETFLKLYVDKPKYKSEYSFKTWLYAIGKNTALNYIKKHRKHRFEPIEDYYYLSDDIDIEAEYIQNEEKLRIHRAIRNLKKEYARVLYLVYFEDLTNSETAEVMGKSLKQISDLIYRAKNALKSELEKGEQNG